MPSILTANYNYDLLKWFLVWLIVATVILPFLAGWRTKECFDSYCKTTVQEDIQPGSLFPGCLGMQVPGKKRGTVMMGGAIYYLQPEGATRLKNKCRHLSVSSASRKARETNICLRCLQDACVS